jgi:hypothetical protein
MPNKKKEFLDYLNTANISYDNLRVPTAEDLADTGRSSYLIEKDFSKYKDYLSKQGDVIHDSPDTWDDKRARAQSGTEKVFNSLGQMAGTFGTALASTVATLGGAAVGGVGQLTDLATGQDNTDFMNTMVNNPVMKGINDFDKYLKEDLVPTYYTKEQQESLLSASTGTDLLNGIGFMASAFVPNAAIGKLFGGWAKMAAVAKAGKLGAVLEAAEAAGKVTNLERKIISSLATHLDKAAPIVGGVVGRIGESSMEAYQTYTQIKESLTAERAQARREIEMGEQPTNPSALLSDEEIENRAKDGRNNVFGGNMVLAISDIAQYTRWFRGGGLGERLAKDGLKTIVKNKTKGEIIGSLIKESAQEAGEEGFQFLLSKGAEKSAKGKSFLQGIEEASGELFTTVEGQKSMLLGAILGGGMSSIAGAVNSKETKKQLNAMAAELTAAGDANARYINDPVTGKKIVNPELSKIATTFAFYEQQKEKALAEGDQDAYDIAEKMQFSHLVEAKIKAGQFDEFVDQLKNMGTTNAEEIKSMFGELPIKNGKEMTPIEVASEKVQLAKRVKEMTEGLQRLPGMEKLGANGINMAKHMLFTQEALREQIKNKDIEIAEVQARAVYNPFPVENSDLFEQEDNLLPQDKLKLIELQTEKEEILEEYKKISDVFKAIVARPEKAQEEADATQEDNISNAVNTLVTELKQEGQDLANAVGQTITVEDAEGNKVEVVVATDEDGNFVNENTGEIIPNEVVLEQTATPVEEVTEEELPEFDDDVITIDEENVIDEYQKKLTVNATAGQALQLDGGNYVVENGERVENPKFVEQTRIFNDPTISDNVVENPADKPNVITFKAELGTITETELRETNARRKSKGLEPMTMEQAQNDSDFVPIVLTLMVNGVAKNTAKSFYHNPEYYYSTAEYEMIENGDIKREEKDKLHAENIAKYKATRADLVQQLKDKKSVILLTAGKSRGVLNYNPKVDTERKTSNVIGILAENFKELLSGIQNKFFSVEGGKTNPINTQGLRIVTAVTVMEDGNFMISTQSNSSKSAFISRDEYPVGTMLMDLISPNGEVVTTSPFTKAQFSYVQRDSLAELVLEKLQGKNTIDVGGTLVTISGTEKVPGILDSVIYVGAVKSKDPDAIASQLYFTKDGRLQLGTKTYDANTEGIYDLIKAHIYQYKSRPHFKFKSTEIFGKNFGIPVKQGDGKYKIENPVNYMEFMFGGKNPLIATALNSTKFVNSYFKFVNNSNGNLSAEKQEVKTEPIVSEPVSEIEAKKAELEQKLKNLDERDARSLEDITPNNPNHPTIKVGMKMNDGLNVIVEKTNTDNWNGEGKGYTIITAVREAAEFDNNGKMIKLAKVETAIFNSKEEADAAVQATFEKVKNLAGKAQEKVNAELADLELITDAKADIERRRQEDLNKEIVIVDKEAAWMYNEGSYMTVGGKYNGNTKQDIIDEINAKYDAELADIESKTEESTKENVADVVPEEVKEKESACNGAVSAPEIPVIPEVKNINNAANDFDW